MSRPLSVISVFLGSWDSGQFAKHFFNRQFEYARHFSLNARRSPRSSQHLGDVCPRHPQCARDGGRRYPASHQLCLAVFWGHSHDTVPMYVRTAYNVR